MSTGKEKTVFLSIASFLTLLFLIGYLINFPFTFFKTSYYKVPRQVKQVVIDAPLKKEMVKLFDRSDRTVGFDHLVFANGFPWSDVKPAASVKIEGDTLIYSIEIKQVGTFRDYRGRIKLFLPKELDFDLSKIEGRIIEDNRK